jgi:hypothetical protein
MPLPRPTKTGPLWAPLSNRRRRTALAIAVLIWTPACLAQTFEGDVGYNALQSLLGSGIPTGAGVNVIQVEASLVDIGAPGYPIYAPDTTNPAFAGKVFSFPDAPSTSPSSHATGVGVIYYGSGGMAYGISSIASYEADSWITDITTNTAAPPFDAGRIANDSWVGSSDDAADTGIMLRSADRLTEIEGLVQIAAMPYGSGNPLLGGAFNVIAVGETAAGNFNGSDAVDSIYVAGRARPDLVAPLNSTSDAAPLVAAAVALLVEVGHDGGSRLSVGATNINGVGTIYDAELPVTIKAALMAGADRSTNNSSTTANVTGYGASGEQASNGLDFRYGAGQLDVLHGYQIISAGEQHSLEGGGSGSIGPQGFDFNAAFGGGAGTNVTGTYKFVASNDLTLSATLDWNLGVSNDSTLATTLHHLTLTLFDTTSKSISSSASMIDNTQNLWANLIQGHGYELIVNSAESGAFSWSYALAWNMSPGQTAPPTPAVTTTATTINAGSAVTLTVTPIGSGPFSYQWYSGVSGDTSNPIQGATAASFRTPALGATSSYWVEVIGPGGTAMNSSTATITVAAGAASGATDAPIPVWALVTLGCTVVGVATRRSKRTQQRFSTSRSRI